MLESLLLPLVMLDLKSISALTTLVIIVSFVFANIGIPLPFLVKRHSLAEFYTDAASVCRRFKKFLDSLDEYVTLKNLKCLVDWFCPVFSILSFWVRFSAERSWEYERTLWPHSIKGLWTVPSIIHSKNRAVYGIFSFLIGAS